MDESFLASVRAAMPSVRKPGPHDVVYKDECVFSFDTPFSRGGLYVNLSTLRGVGADHLRLDRARTGNALYLHLKFVKRKKATSDESTETTTKEQTPTRLAIGVDGGFDVDDNNKYDTEETYALVVCESSDDASSEEVALKSTPYPNPDLPILVCDVCDSVIKHCGFHETTETAAWREELRESRYARDLKQEPATESTKISPDPRDWRCLESGESTNLWLNLGTGHIGSGRQHWDGSGGNGAALRHYEEMKNVHGKEVPLVVKLGTISPSGADVYSYAPDEDDMVTDPLLAEHLAHWGINVMAMQKTEKSMAELQIDLNKGFEFDKITEAGAELEPVSGAKRVGLKNMGNTCYVNSVLQVLKEVPFLDETYRGNSEQIFTTAPADPTGDFPTQFAKTLAALNTDRYARGGREDFETPTIAPRMFKQLVGKNHAEFSTGRQQDAVEYFQHLLEVMTRAERKDAERLGTKDDGKRSARRFEFDVEEKTTCAVSGSVRYVKRRENVLPLEVSVSSATNLREIEAERDLKRQKTQGDGDDKDDKDDKDAIRPVVPFDACLATFAADETVTDWFSTATGAKGKATRRSRFATFPEVLPVQVRRYYVASDWTPKKLNVLVPMPEKIDLEHLRGAGIQPGETPLPEADDGAAGGGAFVESGGQTVSAAPPPAAAPLEPDPAIVTQLVSMGFSENGSRRAAGATRNAGAEPAMEWVFAHMEDPDFNDPYVPKAEAVQSAVPGSDPAASAEAVAMLGAMGFSDAHAAVALRRSDGDVERAADWLFSRADDLDAAVAEAEADLAGDATGASSAGGGATGDASSPCIDGPATYELFGVVSHMGGNTACGHYVAHVKSDGEWYLFNDDKVARSREPPLDLGYLYFYRRA